jgi:hypothetical protein
MLTECTNLNIQGIILRSDEKYLNLTCWRNMTLGRAMVMWCLMGIDISPFDYIVTDGRKLNDYDYNVEAVDFCPWGKMFRLVNSLKEVEISNG